MKILWITHFAPYPPKGGAMQRSYNMIKSVSKSETVTLVSLAPKSKISQFYNSYDEGINDISSNLIELVRSLIMIKHGYFKSRGINKLWNAIRSVFSRSSYDEVVLRSLKMKKVIGELIRVNEYDVIYIDTIGLYQYVNNISTPVIINHHNVESHMMRRRSRLSSNYFEGMYFKSQANKLSRLEETACHKAALNFVCSSLDFKRLKHIAPDSNIKVVPNGVDTSYFARKTPYSYKYNDGVVKLLFVGGLGWYPNKKAIIHFVKDIWPKLRGKGIEFTFTVAGRGEIHELNIAMASDDRINALGFVEDIRPVLESHDLFVCPIRDGGGTKLKILDALAMGIPIIAYPEACEGIDLVYGEDIIVANSTEEFVDKILQAIADEKLLLSISSRGVDKINKQYSYELVGGKLLQYLSDVCG